MPRGRNSRETFFVVELLPKKPSTRGAIFQETRRGPEIHGSQSSMEDWDADLSPCNFATTHFLAERSAFASM